MARRPHASGERKLSTAELLEFRRKIAAMTRNELEVHYRATHSACRLDVSGRLPSAELVQEFVQLWKRLRTM